MVGAVADLIEGGRCKLDRVDSFDEQTWSDSSLPWRSGPVGTVPYAALGPRPGRPVDRSGQPRLRGRGGDRLQAWAPTTPCSGADPRRPVPGGDLPERQLRPRRLERLGRARRGGVLHQPQRLRRQPARRPPRLAAPAAATSSWSSARVPGRPTPPSRCRRHDTSVACSPRRGSRTTSTSGVTTRPTTGTVARADRAPPAAVRLTHPPPTLVSTGRPRGRTDPSPPPACSSRGGWGPCPRSCPW